MKKILCYLGIIILLALVLFPPILRIVLTDQEEEEEVIVVERIILSCSNEEFIASTMYDNDKISMIALKKVNVDNIEGETITGEELISLFDTVKNKGDVVYHAVDDGETVSIDFSLSEHKNLDIDLLTNNLENQKEFYEQQNLTCMIRR